MSRSCTSGWRTSRAVKRLCALALFGAVLAACAAPLTQTVTRPIAKVEHVDGSIIKITLSEKDVDRIGIKTAPVAVSAGDAVIPYSALVYDTKGDTYAYTNPQSLVFIRHSVRVISIRGDRVVIADGPAAGASVVTVGASELLGIELGIGS
jgi:multidrug efflux pump subunit AcrA (membrane-fusion protein)